MYVNDRNVFAMKNSIVYIRRIPRSPARSTTSFLKNFPFSHLENMIIQAYCLTFRRAIRDSRKIADLSNLLAP